MKRRHFLQTLALTTAITSACSSKLWISRSPAHATVHSSKRLIVVFLRGAVDGLNVVIPYQDTAYYQLRQTIAIPKPGAPAGALDLDGSFGLHPVLASLLPLWQQQSLAFVHSCGSSYFTRSHFDAQTYMENGTPGVKSTADGWMNRLMTVLPNQSPVEAVSIDATMPLILQGHSSAINFPSGTTLVQTLPLDSAPYGKLFDQLYDDGQLKLDSLYQEGRTARQMLRQGLTEDYNPTAPLPNQNGGRASFANNTRQLAELMVNQPEIQLAFLSLTGGWDTHVAQGGSTGTLATNLRALVDGLSGLVDGLGEIYKNTVIVVMSEFGRTVEENQNRGTDHGYGNVMWVLGGGIRGGKVYGDWRGLASPDLYQQRFLPVTTDFRDPLSTILREHLELETASLQKVFPGFTPRNSIELLS
jgi:uncharacterized protein (DUF1501 family)